ncbi:unnamed protein product, partial [Sphacelaria rigidula]
MLLEGMNGIDLAVAEAEDACLRAKKDPPPPPANNHIFIYAVAPDPDAIPEVVEEHMRELMTRFQGRIQLLGINHLEVKMVCGLGGGSVLAPIRVFVSNPTGYAVRIETYLEVR